MTGIPSIPLNETSLHRLRSPITLVRGYSQMLLNEAYGPLTKEQKEIMEKLIDIVAALSNFIDSHD